ncbi:unnamed protein product [Meloidogyne enterolobii]|uniref:Uncharacterized protein n=1 Tax=Meloidogyne enterolobii TaxID=390850 RepID=A0ACB1A7J3_MELEN
MWNFQRRGIIRVLKFERVVGYLGEGNYFFNSSLAWGINRGWGIIRGRGINRVNTGIWGGELLFQSNSSMGN